jgi:hypothetical protein
LDIETPLIERILKTEREPMALVAVVAAGARGQRGCAAWPTAIAALDGTLPLDSPPGEGTRLHAEIPLSRRA